MKWPIHSVVLFVAIISQLVSCAHAQPSVNQQEQSLYVGAEVLLSDTTLLNSGDFAICGKRLAVVANQSSLVGDIHLVDALLAKGMKVTKIFCPEHGFRGNAEAGATIKNGTDSIFVNTIALREAKASSAIENIFTTDDELYRSLTYQEDDYLEGPAKEILHYREALWKGFQDVKRRVGHSG